MKNFYINPHFEKWNKTIIEMNKAMLSGDMILAESLHNTANSEYEAYKDDLNRTYNCNNFGLANYVFENVLPTIFKDKPKIVNKFMTTIKEDKNLSAQFQFYNALNECSNEDVTKYINEALDLVKTKIDYKTIKESNNRLASIIKENHLIPSELISDDKLSLYENCDYLLTNKRKISNLNEYSTKVKNVADYVKTNIKPLNEEKKNLFNLIQEYENKYSAVLTEEEKSFVQEIMDFKGNVNSNRKEKFFENLKNECLKGVDKLLETCSSDEKNDLLTIKEEINNKQFSESNLVKDVAKLLELRDIILDK